MSLKDKIREAFTEKKTISKWDQDTSPNIYNLDKFLRKSGYRLIEIVVLPKNDKALPEIILEPVTKDHPDINHSVDEGIFYIEMKKYGELEASEVREIIKGYENALAIVDYLSELDLYDLELDLDEE